MEHIQLGKGCYSLQQGFQVPHDHPSPKYSLSAWSICQSIFSLYKLLEKEIIEIKYCCWKILGGIDRKEKLSNNGVKKN